MISSILRKRYGNKTAFLLTYRRRVTLVTLSLLFILHSAISFQFLPNSAIPTANAINACDRKAINIGSLKTDNDLCVPEPCEVPNSDASVTSGPIFILGDSITVGATNTYKEKLSSLNPVINASGGRAINIPGLADPKTTGLQAVKDSRVDIESAKAIIIALGTNGGNSDDTIKQLLDPEVPDSIKNINPDAKLYWIDTMVIGRPSYVPTINESNKAIYGNAEKYGYTVISWAKTVTPELEDPTALTGSESDTNGYIVQANEYVHLTSEGNTALVDQVAKSLSGSAQGSNENCNCSIDADPEPGADHKPFIWSYFAKKGLEDYKIAGIMGNMQAESGFNPRRVEGTSTPGGDSETPGSNGYGLVQFTPGTKIVPAAEAAGKKPSSATFQLDFFWAQLENEEKSAGDLIKNASDLEAATRGMVAYERFRDWNTPLGASKIAERIAMAQAILDEFKDASVTTNCIEGGEGIVAGDIVQTALGLAWKDKRTGKIEKEDATPAYQDAFVKYNNTFVKECYKIYTDCGVFVATTMIASGVDPSYPKIGTSAQIQHARNNPEKYTVLDNISSTDQLHPGDILASPSHTMIFVGNQPEGFNVVDASAHQNGDCVSNSPGRVPGAQNFYGTWTVMRTKK